jgi:hypothetical protein
MADSKVYVVAPREDNGKLYGSVPVPLENARELKIWYDSSAPYLYKFEFSAGNRWLEYGASEYHYERGLQRWVYEVDIDGQTVKIEVAMASAAPTSTYMYPLDDLLGCPCPSAYLTDGMLFVVRLHADEQCAKSAAPSAQLPARPATPASNEDFLPQYDDQLLKSAGLNRQFLRSLLEIVRRRGVVKTVELARALKLPKKSLRLGMALSILVQERLIYQKSDESYSINPVDYQPASADMMWRVVKYVCDNPGADTSELVKAIGGDASRLSRVARYLAAEGLIRRQLVVRRRGIADCATWLHYPAD